jgi:hypothetical protein
MSPNRFLSFVVGFVGLLSVFAAIVLAVPASAAPVPASAALGPTHCGQTITTNTKLTSDLTNCPQDGLVIGADNLRLNLTGHAITGAPHPFLGCFSGGPPPGPCFGVDTNGHNNLVITNGTVSNFDTDVGSPVGLSSGDHVSFLTTTNSTSGDIRVADDNSVAFNRPSGIIGIGSHNRVTHKQGTAGSSIVAFLGNGDRIEGNTLSTIELEFATNSHVEHNILSKGVLLVASHSDSNTIESNILLQSHIAVIGSAHDFISGNFVSGTEAPLAAGIIIGFDPTTGSISDGTMVTNNRIYKSANDGILIDASNSLVRANIASVNGHDGIENDDSTTTLAHNVADDNANLGIESIAGAKDRGGNRADGNGNPLQCRNVTCR